MTKPKKIYMRIVISILVLNYHIEVISFVKAKIEKNIFNLLFFLEQNYPWLKYKQKMYIKK